MKNEEAVRILVPIAAMVVFLLFVVGFACGHFSSLGEAAAMVESLSGAEVGRLGSAWTITGGDRVVVGETLKGAVDAWVGVPSGEEGGGR